MLTPEQAEQVEKQLQKHKGKWGMSEIKLDEDTKLELIVNENVFGSDMMSSGINLARFLFQNPHLYKDKEVLDLGCGPGTQGLITLKYGA